ncbi:MAG: prepilin-type N-terminal cleavage/methylation domain-containing protein [bacterium]
MYLRKRQGFTMVEVLLASAIFSMIILVVVRLYMQTQRSIRKSQELTNIQQLAKISLEEIAREIRQTLNVRTTEIGDIVSGSNFNLAPGGSNQLCIFVPKISSPGDRAIADRVIYRLDNFGGSPNRLVQQLTTYSRDISGNIVSTDHPAIPIISDMDVYRSDPGGIPDPPLMGLFKHTFYSYDYVNFYWDYDPNPVDPRGVMALGLTVSVRDGTGRIQNRLSVTTVVTSRPITGVPR